LKRARVAAGRRRVDKPGILLEIPSDTEFLSLVREAAKCAAQMAGFADDVAESVALAVDECTTNVIKHAYKDAPGEKVELRLEYVGSDLSIEVLDHGRKIDKSATPKVDLEKYAAERRKGGFGVHLMEKIMDSVAFRRSGGCNVCRMRKRKPPAPKTP
jgi:sigma-B regulation protein RsbU (phosphoserine phosphatase)